MIIYKEEKNDLVAQLVEHPRFYIGRALGSMTIYKEEKNDLVAQLVEHPDFISGGPWVR